MKRNTDVLVEVDDFKNAIAIARDLKGETAPDAFSILAQWCATMREFYCEIGRETEQLSQRTKS